MEEENRRLKRIVGGALGAEPDPAGGERKKMVGPSSRRRAVNMSVEGGLGNRAQACRAQGLARSSYYRVSTLSAVRHRLQQRIVALSREPPRYGCPRVTALLRRAGHRINAKCVQRVGRAEGLQVRKRQRRTRRLGGGTAQRQEATHTNHVWSWDFVADQTQSGTPFRILTLLDEHTRRCLAAHVAWSIRAMDVIGVVEAAMKRHGAPQHIRSDNGPEPERSAGSQPEAARRASVARQFIAHTI